jgi:hypothetical protein
MFQVMRLLQAKVVPSSSIASSAPKSVTASRIASNAIRIATKTHHSPEVESKVKGPRSGAKIEPSHNIPSDHHTVAATGALSAVTGEGKSRSVKLQDLHISLNYKISKAWLYMVWCGLLMVGLVVITLLIGLDVQYKSANMMVLYQLLVMVDILKSLCEINILSTAIEPV